MNLVVSQVFREEKLIAAVSATLGVAAIGVEMWFIALGALILIVIIYAVVHIIDLNGAQTLDAA